MPFTSRFKQRGNGGEPEGEELPFFKAFFIDRFLAKFIDLLIMGAFFAIPAWVGPLAGTTYIFISDGLMGGQSAGKKIVGLKVVSIADENIPCDFKSSIMRNSVFGALIAWRYLIGWIPYLGALLTIIAWGAVIIIEMALIFTDEAGARFGDRIARTRVKDAKGCAPSGPAGAV